MSSKEELLKAMSLNNSGIYTEAFVIFVNNEGLLNTPLLISHFALSKVGSDGEGRDFDRAIALCIKSLKSDIKNPDIYFNLAKIYLLSGKKALAIKAIDKGLKYDSDHEGLVHLHKELGERREPAVGFLSREAAINKSIGKLTYKPDKSQDKPSD